MTPDRLVRLLRIRSLQQAIALGIGLLTEDRKTDGLLLHQSVATNVTIDEPTRGVDVGAKREIHTLLHELAGRGVAIVMVSSELPAVIGVSDRIMVMREGRITTTLDRAEATEERIMAYATRQVA